MKKLIVYFSFLNLIFITQANEFQACIDYLKLAKTYQEVFNVNDLSEKLCLEGQQKKDFLQEAVRKINNIGSLNKFHYLSCESAAGQEKFFQYLKNTPKDLIKQHINLIIEVLLKRCSRQFKKDFQSIIKFLNDLTRDNQEHDPLYVNPLLVQYIQDYLPDPFTDNFEIDLYGPNPFDDDKDEGLVQELNFLNVADRDSDTASASIHSPHSLIEQHSPSIYLPRSLPKFTDQRPSINYQSPIKIIVSEALETNDEDEPSRL